MLLGETRHCTLILEFLGVVGDDATVVIIINLVGWKELEHSC